MLSNKSPAQTAKTLIVPVLPHLPMTCSRTNSLNRIDRASEEIAAAVLYLASDAAKFTTSTTLLVRRRMDRSVIGAITKSKLATAI